MRVVAGSARGRRLRAPAGDTTRPTTDRVREAVFNALGSLGALDGAVVVDLFAGSGALGIEALSRGAASAVFVETDRRAVEVIEDNLAELGFGDRATVIRRPVDDAVASLPAPVDLVLADPPYDFDGWQPLLTALAEVLDPEGFVVLESDRPVEVAPGWEKVREKSYGGTVIAFAVPAGAPDTTGADA